METFSLAKKSPRILALPIQLDSPIVVDTTRTGEMSDELVTAIGYALFSLTNIPFRRRQWSDAARLEGVARLNSGN